MGVTVYYAEISGSKEVKKRQPRVMMILESKPIPYEAIDITAAGEETAKEFMMKNGKIRGDIKYVQSPQIFNGEVYCGDYEDFDLANENDVLEEFLNTPKIDRSSPLKNGKVENGSAGASREGSSEPKVENTPEVIDTTAPAEPEVESAAAEVLASPPVDDEVTAETEPSSRTDNEDAIIKDDDVEEEEEAEEKSQVDK